MRLWQATLYIGASCLAAAVAPVGAADVDTAPREERHYVEIPLGDRPRAASPAPAASQPTLRVSPEIELLVRQLGDDDFRKRESAVAKLKEVGRPALAALKQFRDAAGDPEVASRLDAVIRFFERPPVPGRLADAGTSAGMLGRMRGAAGNVNIRFSANNGVNRVEVREPGREIRIEYGVNGIQMAVTGDEDGKKVTRNFQARTPDELAQQNPEAFQLFKRWTGGAHGRDGLMGDRMLRALERRELLQRQQQQLRGGARVMPLPQIPRAGDADEMPELRDLILRRDAVGDLDAQHQEMRKFLDRLDVERRELKQRAEALEQRVREVERRAAEAAVEAEKSE